LSIEFFYVIFTDDKPKILPRDKELVDSITHIGNFVVNGVG